VTLATIEIYVRLGRRSEVISALEAWNDPILAQGNAREITIRRIQLRFDPLWDPLRGEERFAALRRRFEEAGAQPASASKQ
jgi:hypothetical protein